MAGAEPQGGRFVVSIDVDVSNLAVAAERQSTMDAVLACAEQFECPMTFGFRDLASGLMGSLHRATIQHEVASMLPKGEHERADLVRHLQRVRSIQPTMPTRISTLFTNASAVLHSDEMLIKYGVSTVRSSLPVPTAALVGPSRVRYGLQYLCVSTSLPGHVARVERALGAVVDQLEDAAIRRSVFHLAVCIDELSPNTLIRQLTPVLQIAHSLRQAGHLSFRSIRELRPVADERAKTVVPMQSILHRAA